MQANRCTKLIRHCRFVLLLACLGLLALTGVMEGQDKKGPKAFPHPSLAYIMPMGAKVGTSVEVVLTGSDLDETENLYFSHPGIKAEKVADPPPPPPDPKKAAKGTPPPAAANASVKFKVTVAPDVPLGIHDVRIVNKLGLSNPRAFVVGDMTEVNEKEPNNDIPDALKVELNTTVNGVINAPTDVDYVSFAGKKGQRVVLSCLSSSIDSRLTPVIELYNTAGQRLTTNRNYNETDAVCDAILPADGDYFVRLFQFTHVAGNAEYFYRLTLSTAPWIDAVFPPMIEPGKSAQVTIYGRNLPGGQPDPTATVGVTVLEKATVTINVPADPMVRQRLSFSGYVSPVGGATDGFEYRVKNASGSSNPAFIGISQAPVVTDNGANVTRETAQEVNSPCEIAGRFDKKRFQGWYALNAKAGQVYSIDVQSDRLGSPTDIVLTVYGADGKVLAELDDDADTTSPQFYTRTSDPARYRLQVPADGKYLMLVKNQGSMGTLGPRTYYRLRITPEQPDFRLVVMPPKPRDPEGNTIFQGGNQEYVVYAWRQDGFNSPITLSADKLPPGLTCKPQVIGSGMRTGSVILTAADDAAPWTGEFQIKGKATINGQEVVREARSGSVVWGLGFQPQDGQQVNTPVFSRIDRGVTMAIREKAPFVLQAAEESVTTQLGSKVKVPIKIQRPWPEAKVPISVVVANLPTGFAFNGKNAPLAIAADKSETTLEVDVAANATPGTYSLVFRGTGQVPFSKDPKGAKAPVAITQPSTPIVVKVLPKTVANVTTTPPAALKIGGPTDLIVKVQRLYDYDGEFKVELVESAMTKGIAAEAVTIPPGKDEAKLVLNIAPDAAPGNRAGVIVRATAMIEGKTPALHEAKINLNLTK